MGCLISLRAHQWKQALPHVRIAPAAALAAVASVVVLAAAAAADKLLYQSHEFPRVKQKLQSILVLYFHVM